MLAKITVAEAAKHAAEAPDRATAEGYIAQVQEIVKKTI